MNKDRMLKLLSHYKYGTPFNDYINDATIEALEELVFLRGYGTTPQLSEHVPDGTTHVDLNDDTDSKWLKLEDNTYNYYAEGCWYSCVISDVRGIITLGEWRKL